MSVFDFTTLSPDLILDGLESTGLFVDSGLLALNSYENRVYQFHDEDKKKYVTKFYRPQRWNEAELREEHSFSFELAKHELPLVAPLKIGGESLFSHQGFHFAIYPCRGGRIFEVDNLDQLEWMGRFLGRIHAVAATKPFKHRPTYNKQEMLFQATDIIKDSGFVPHYLSKAFFTILEQVVDIAAEQYQPSHEIRLHGDCHAGNILWTDKGPHFVDLDDCRMGPAIQDLWMMLSGDRQQRLLQLDTMLSGYEEFYSFEPKQLILIESLRTMRVVNYMAWLCKRWQDPAFPHNFPWFNTDKYWEQQILMLKEQVSALQQPPLSLLPA
ncbi:MULTISPECIES: serine/threonine protein kinase [unclassified Colwellia]|uniref:serine/threonine protein kinase n=1 Tax=unclassified Colwellia TaxID=196834 RepID=UPI0015F4DF91|nr:MULTISPECIES: serine/threonine protein kinase [unclassified Colwellia]MBA6357787.1 serine/threonine protein kinase [Colwellia sp. BRX8-3]MBA6361573.1 serine/threonine protein kinase [Colwellia sp. BRX8-6]MBA6366092.1 serine/threonine protein kinase [Colwellia sp. BRX8-5]MBA6376049.1 serine/threonine protein kinase [Colwellia sp. BRX8-2]